MADPSANLKPKPNLPPYNYGRLAGPKSAPSGDELEQAWKVPGNCLEIEFVLE